MHLNQWFSLWDLEPVGLLKSQLKMIQIIIFTFNFLELNWTSLIQNSSLMLIENIPTVCLDLCLNPQERPSDVKSLLSVEDVWGMQGKHYLRTLFPSLSPNSYNLGGR